MGAENGKEKRSGIWAADKDGKERKLEGVFQLKFYGKEAREEPRAIFNPRHVLVPHTSEIVLEAGEEGVLVRFRDSESFEEREALDQAKREEDAAQGEAPLNFGKGGLPT